MDREKRVELLEKKVAELEETAQPKELDINEISSNIQSLMSKTCNNTE